jgi:hypothetical protein
LKISNNPSFCEIKLPCDSIISAEDASRILGIPKCEDFTVTVDPDTKQYTLRSTQPIGGIGEQDVEPGTYKYKTCPSITGDIISTTGNIIDITGKVIDGSTTV